ncbi:MAG: hypothetical protein DRR06_03960 [Gammaproteobacteria bacterium]|nr:MAG: hypothetical protein DRR06_03960 [Gammaproteobacteria bacterium]RLA50688.1 MAG: hypothetical protein DRR42_12415 [Gammaproteobacteria bacterium]
MRMIVLLLAVAITGYLVMSQLKQATPDNEDDGAVPYGEEMDRARELGQSMQEDVDERLEQMDAMGK